VQIYVLGGFALKEKFNDNDHHKPMMPKYKLAHAYVPFQKLGEVYDCKTALCKGTLFPELYMPYKYSKDNRKF